MPNPMARLKSRLQEQGVDPSLLVDLDEEYSDLVHRVDQLELLLITIVRTGWPWDEEGEPNDIHRTAREGYMTAMKEARDLLGMGMSSRITRTEPKT